MRRALPTRFVLASLPVQAEALEHVSEPGHEGAFVFKTGDYSAQVAADTTQVNYVAPSRETDGSAGAWVRQSSGSSARGSNEWYDIRNYGAVCDGVTDDTDAINEAIAAMPSISGSFNGSAGTLYIPAGRTITRGGHVIPSNKRMRWLGAGAYNSILYKKSGSTADLLTFNAQNSGTEGLSLDGNRGAASGSGLVFNAGFGFSLSSMISNFYGNGISLGLSSVAINFMLRDLILRFNRGYGIEVGALGSTDGGWSNVNVGTSGLSGIKLGSGAQLMSNVHVWESGLESLTDRAGFRIDSGHNELTGCVSETNLGNGVRIASGAHGNSITGCDIWGNASAGIYSFGSDRNNITGGKVRNNGSVNSAGASSVGFAGISNESGRYWSVDGVQVFDDATALAAGVAPSATYPFLGRAAIQTQSYSYAESNTGIGLPAENSLTGNQMRKEYTRTGEPILNLSASNIYHGNNFGALAVPTVASAATITLPAHLDYVQVTGTAGITSIAAAYVGRRVVLEFTNAAPGTVTDGGNLALASDFAPTQGDTISLICDGTNWRETARSGNI